MNEVKERWKSVRSCALKLFLILAFILLSPLLLFLYLSLLLYKHFLLPLLTKYFRPKCSSLLNEWEAFHATDRMWEDSRSSVALVLVLEGNIPVEEVRELFTSSVINSEHKEFPRLTQIPVSFGGHYFWQRANYFLIHEHIREILTPMDEEGLKKFAGTLLTLPFPNKRPPWEILVFPNYSWTSKLEFKIEEKEKSDLKEIDLEGGSDSDSEELPPTEIKTPLNAKYSAILVRLHGSIGDLDVVTRITALLCNKSSYSLQSMKLPDLTRTKSGSVGPEEKEKDKERNWSCDEGKQGEVEKGVVDSLDSGASLMSKARSRTRSSGGESLDQSSRESPAISILRLPANLVKVFLSFVKGNLHHPNPNSTIVSWGSDSNQFRNTSSSSSNFLLQDQPVLELSSLVKVVPKSGVNLSQDPDFSVMMCQNGRGRDKSFRILHPFKLTEDSEKSSTFHLIKETLAQQNASGESFASPYFLKLLTLLPHPILRYMTQTWFRGCVLLFQCQSAECSLNSILKSCSNKGMQSDLIFIGEHQLLDVIPLSGLQFSHCAVSCSTIQFNNCLKLSIVISPDLIPVVQRSSSMSAKQVVEKQSFADNLVSQALAEMHETEMNLAKRKDHISVAIS